MLDKNSATPLWEQLEGILKERIDSGVWTAGDRIASENELSREFEISRMTVRSVLSRLVQEDLLYRVPGKGTFVSEEKIEKKHLLYTSIREQLEELGMEIVTKVIDNKVIMPNSRIAKKLNINSTRAVYYIERIRYVQGKPLSLHRTFLSHLVNPLINEKRLAEDHLCRILEEDYNLVSTHTKESLEMVYAKDRQSKLLEVDATQPLLLLKEERYIGNAIAEYTEIYFKGDQMRVTFEYDNRNS